MFAKGRQKAFRGLCPKINGLRRQHMNYTYIVKCNDGSLYTGWTNDLEKRMEAHNSGQGAKYTRGRSPVELVYFEAFDTKEEAMSREWHIKRLSRIQKLRLIEKKG
jgi:putative endonuclease